MRHRSSCRRCRQRHKRCLTHPGSPQCNECEQAGELCYYEVKPQFRFFHRSSFRRRRSKPQSKEASPSPAQGRNSSSSPNQIIDFRDSLPHQSPNVGTERNSTNKSASGRQRRVSYDDLAHHPWPSPMADPLSLHDPQIPSPETIFHVTTQSDFPNQSAIDFTHSSASTSPVSLGIPPPSSLPLTFTEREAYLMGVYIHQVSLSPDSCDEERHFATTVPKLALEEPIVLYGIFALASRFDEIQTKTQSDVESTQYHNQCLELLIDALSKPPETYGVPLLTAVVLSRLYEEFDVGKDTQFYHLKGTRNLLGFNAITKSAQNGGLAEAVCWLHLHQVIYISMVHKQKPDLYLEIFKTFQSYDGSSDRSHVNRAVYLLARVLREFFSGSSDISQVWTQLETELDDWYRGIPRSFQVLYEAPINITAGRTFPSIWMLSSLQVMALEYYYASRAIICLYRCNSGGGQAFGFDAMKARKSNEESILYYLRRSIGLARGNEYFPGAYYMPSYVLFLCKSPPYCFCEILSSHYEGGHLIRDPTERDQCVQFLGDMADRVPRESYKLIQTLQKEWAELDGLGR
ncbi:unnamed protein product [Clonostachys rhizophaga]|uniref:Zn(2)-C6 fungal-type domain-containing protein n=1 Tax=Clonostachys rhizophaga TaxID=160324 RepID=A0A9N9V6Q9_9HYPO|nr:unnamed protein product [Clonostachys rhizophaga]